MGKKIIPPHDPERLARVMNEKQRMFGVDAEALAHQAAERKRVEEEAARQKQQEEQRQAIIDAEISKRRAAAEAARHKVAVKTANQLKKQMNEKEAKDAALQELYSNQLKDTYFTQFGTSHR